MVRGRTTPTNKQAHNNTSFRTSHDDGSSAPRPSIPRRRNPLAPSVSASRSEAAPFRDKPRGIWSRGDRGRSFSRSLSVLTIRLVVVVRARRSRIIESGSRRDWWRSRGVGFQSVRCECGDVDGDLRCSVLVGLGRRAGVEGLADSGSRSTHTPCQKL